MPNNDRRKGLDVMLASLAAGSTNRAAAEAAGIDERTVRRHLEDPEVQEMLEAARVEFRRRTMDRLVSLNTKAVNRLEQLLDDEDTPPAVLARLIDMTLNQSQRWVEVEELRARIDALGTGAPEDIAARVREALRPAETDDAA